jgi:hypothetical protein
MKSKIYKGMPESAKIIIMTDRIVAKELDEYFDKKHKTEVHPSRVREVNE